MSMVKRIARAAFGAGALVVTLAALAAANDFPTRQVTLVVPFPPGGVADQTARPVAAALERIWKQPVVVSNRPGAAGGVGMASVANARPDGYTIMVTTSAISSIPASDAVFDRPPTIQTSQFTPLALIVADPLLVVVKGDAPWKTFKDFVENAKKRPGDIAYSSSGVYGPLHVPTEMFSHAAGIKLKHIAYTGGGPAITSLLGGHVALTTGAPSVLAPQIKSGALRPLAVTGDKRIAAFPDVPTLDELGYKNAEYYLWAGLFTSSKVPPDAIKALRQGLAAVVKDPEFMAHMAKLGTPLQYMDGPDFATFWKKDTDRIEAAIRRIGKLQ